MSFSQAIHLSSTESKSTEFKSKDPLQHEHDLIAEFNKFFEPSIVGLVEAYLHGPSKCSEAEFKKIEVDLFRRIHCLDYVEKTLLHKWWYSSDFHLKQTDLYTCYDWTLLGLMHKIGIGVDRDQNQATYCFEKAGQYYFSQTCLGFKNFNIDEARKYHEVGIAANFGPAIYLLALQYVKKENYKNAMELVLIAKDLGYAPSLRLLGDMQYHGWGVEKDEKLAIENYEKAIMLGVVSALKSLIDHYLNIRAYEKIPPFLFLLETRADPHEIFHYISAVYKAMGGVENQRKAKEYLNKAADADSLDAIRELAFQCCAQRDYKQAVALHTRIISSNRASEFDYYILGQIYQCL